MFLYELHLLMHAYGGAYGILVNILLKMEWNLCKYTLYFAVMVLLVPLVDCEFTTLYVVEGDVASLTFSYSCDSTQVTLQRIHGAPFFNSEGSNSDVPSNMEVRSGTDGEVCFLNLTINPVTRDDRGGYILFAYKSDPSLYEDDRVLLNVAYPPGKASCSSEGYIDPDWITLQCTAPVGTVSGYILCYQDGNAIPPLTSLQENDATLSQSLLAKLGPLVYCCSSTLGKTKDICECKDTVWDSIRNNEVNNFTDPCPPTEPISHPSLTHYPTDIPGGSMTDTSITAIHMESTVLHRTRSRANIVLIVAVCLLLYGCMVFIVCYLYKKRAKLIELSAKPTNQHAQMTAVSETANEDQKPFTATCTPKV